MRKLARGDLAGTSIVSGPQNAFGVSEPLDIRQAAWACRNPPALRFAKDLNLKR